MCLLEGLYVAQLLHPDVDNRGPDECIRRKFEMNGEFDFNECGSRWQIIEGRFYCSV